MGKTKILCIGDSTAMPNGVDKQYEDTWQYLLKSTFQSIDCITFFMRGLTTEALVTMGKKIEYGIPKGADLLEFWRPDIVVLQLGVVDCAPRLFNINSFERKLINRFPLKLFRDHYIRMVKKMRMRKPEHAIIKPDQFKNNLVDYFNRCQKLKLRKLIVIGIPIPDQRMLDKNPLIIDAIVIYNNIYRQLEKRYPFIKVVFPLDATKYPEEIIYTDGYHPNPLGFKLIFDDLKKTLVELKVS